MARVGRFQVMATLQAARAHELGLNLDEAKSWGLNRAVFYAAAKRGFRNAGPPGGKAAAAGGAGRGTRDERPARDDPEFSLGNEKAFLARDPARGLLFKFGDEEQTPRDFDWQVVRRFQEWDTAWDEAVALVRAADPDDLKSQHRFYEHVYKPNRDKLAASWAGAPASGVRRGSA